MITVIESPFAGDIEGNITYARACVKDSILRNELPVASHILYTQPGILDDSDPKQRLRGITTGHMFYYTARLCAVYTDLGISQGMKDGINVAKSLNVPIEYRTLYTGGTNA
jgi:hypothetical protein